jgi:hypothetical protein
MSDKDWRDTVQSVSSVVAAMGSIAIPLAIFLIGNRITDRQKESADKQAEAQRAATEKQLEADRVERMLAHLASDKADEKKLAVRVLEFFVSERQFPAVLLPALVEIASSDGKEDVAATATAVLQKVADGPASDKTTAEAKQGLSSLPPRIDVHSSAVDSHKADAALLNLSHGGVVVPRQAPTAVTPQQTELRYYRKETSARLNK